MSIRSLLEHVGIDLKGKSIYVGDRLVDPAPIEDPAPGEEPPAPYVPRYEEIANRFTYHPPTHTQELQYKVIRRHAKELGFLIEQYCPVSEEKKTALNRLDEVVMHANAAIARHS